MHFRYLQIRCAPLNAHAANSHGFGDVLDRLFAQDFKRRRKIFCRLIVHRTRDIDLARLTQSLETSGDIDAITMNVVTLNNHITDIDADPEHYSAIFGQGVIAPRHRYLNGERVAHRIHGAPELDQNSVTARFDDASAVGGNPGVDNLGMQAPKACPRTFLVLLEKSRIADHISDKNCREPSLDAFFAM